MRPKKQRNVRHRHLLAVVSDHTKYLRRVDGVLERYDLTRDPEERDPLTATNEELAKHLAAAGIRSTATGTDEDGEQELSPETIEELKALGYLY